MGTALVVSGDAAATANNIVTSELTFRLGFVVNLVANAAYIAVVALLYELLKPAGKTLSLVAAFFGLTGCIAGAAMSLDGLAPLVLLKGSPSLAAFGTDQLQALSMLSLRMSGVGLSIALTYFGLYCLTLGFLVAGATFLPRVLGLLLALAGVAYLAGGFASFLAPAIANQISAYALAAAVFGESAFTLWLLAFGVNEAKWQAQAGAT